jgi:hypothetical protein
MNCIDAMSLALCEKAKAFPEVDRRREDDYDTGQFILY